MSARLVFAMLLLIAGAAVPAFAQADDGPPDFQEIRQRAEQRMKEMLGVNDDQWKDLQPKLQKIQQLQRDALPRAQGMFFGPGPGGPGGGVFIRGGGPGGPPPGGFGPGGPGGGEPSVVQEKIRDLRETLDSKDATPEDIKAKAQALRDARAQAKADLAKAQDDLRSTATPKQEAALLSLGYLD